DRMLVLLDPKKMDRELTLFDRVNASGQVSPVKVNDLKLDKRLKNILPETLLPVQSISIGSGLLDRKDHLVVSATATGKTLIGEIGGVSNILSGRGKMLFLVPLVALANQKYDQFTNKYSPLGLTLAHAIIGRHEGDIRVISHQDRGSTFLIKLPLAESAPLFKRKTKKKGLRDSRILIIGEGGALIDILSQLLTSKGSTSTVTSSNHETLKLLRGKKFDLVIADQNVPNIETSKMIRERKRLQPGLPVALINARENPGSRNTPIKMGADLAIGRPLDIDRLLSLLSSLLAHEVPY
ncbi:MAG TPA: response regulator, partial [Desulfobacterales bacterium]|nr:response regulator [Desulfobacterales bacterium]